MVMRRLAMRTAVVLVGGAVGLAVSAGPAAADPSEQELLRLQRSLQERAETAALVSELARLRHESTKAIIENMR
jgi:hypothetical protein